MSKFKHLLVKKETQMKKVKKVAEAVVEVEDLSVVTVEVEAIVTIEVEGIVTIGEVEIEAAVVEEVATERKPKRIQTASRK